MTEPVVEWAPFKVRPGTTRAALLEASEHLQRDFLATRPGFLRRELVAGGDRYADIIWWRDRAAVDAAMAAVAASPACASYFALMDINVADPEAGVSLFETLRSY